MIRLTCTLMLFLLAIGRTALAAEPAQVTAPGAEAKKLAGEFIFTEGPVADKEGNVYFSDIRNNRIHKWSLDGSLSTFAENTNGANGLCFDADGGLLACQGGPEGRAIAKLGMDGSRATLAAMYEGKRLNSPNDLCRDAKGGIYFTDPRYGDRAGMEQDGEHVYYLKPDRKTLIRVVDDMKRPNGLIASADGKTLYVADHGGSSTYAYDIQSDGALTNKKLFARRGSDGVALDEHGNLYLTADKVWVYRPDGSVIQSIATPERPANVCFGGKDGKTLFITARTSLYSIDMQVKGAHVK